MKITDSSIFQGRNIYSHKKCIKLLVDLEGYCEIPSKDIPKFNDRLVEMIPELKKHRCGIDEEQGFIKRLREGTYLAHICEHIIIAIQNMLGIDIAYGKAREIDGDKYLIVYQYQYPKVGIEVAKLAIDIINFLIEDKIINFDYRFMLLKEIMNDEIIGPSTAAICNAAINEGLPILRLGSSNFYQIGYGKQGRIIEASITNNTSCVSADISCDKLLTKELLEIQSLPIARGTKVNDVISLLKEAEKIGYPVVLKPQYGNKGNGVILDIKDDKELISQYQKLTQRYKDIIIEEYWKGNDYRVCVVNNKVVAASLRLPPFIVGNGKKTIQELINDLNTDFLRGDDHEKPLTKVKVDKELIDFIGSENYSLDDILEIDKTLFLRKNANLSTGGTAVDCTNLISEFNKDICIRAAKAIGLDVCGVDICTDDISKPLIHNGIIMEINAAPGLRMHLYPSTGDKRDVGKDIVKMMYNNEVKNIPIISVTGTNGKTTTTRLINSTLFRMGYSAGMTSTEGIYLNGKCIDKGDDTGADSAKCILLNRDVEVAVLETARGGIIRKGLAYDLADVAVITNITEDHLGSDGIDSMEELCSVKALVGEAVKKDGYVVINADDKWSKEIINRFKSNIIYFSKRPDNELIAHQINLGRIAVYIKDEYICVNNNNREYKVSKIQDIPITLNGSLEFNIENAMAACGALVGLGIDYSMIKIGLQNFELNSKENAGRFNIYDYNGIRVILDYGHNIEGYKKVLKAVREITLGKVIGVIGIPGDRKDNVAKDVGKISGELLDYVIIKEDKDTRGRTKGEIAELIKSGVLNTKSEKDISVVLDEVEALKEALLTAKVGDTVIVFYEKRLPLVKVINKGEDEKNIWNDIATSM